MNYTIFRAFSQICRVPGDVIGYPLAEGRKITENRVKSIIQCPHIRSGLYDPVYFIAVNIHKFFIIPR